MSDLTIIIPTHNRHQYLARVLEYYKCIEHRLIVLDSTNTSFHDADKLSLPIEYFHVNGLDYNSKLIFGLKKVNTEYCVLIADDDFITPNGLNYCLRFLRNNSDYASAEGSYVGFKNSEISHIELQDIYEYARAFDFNGNTAVQRAKQVFKQYTPFFYAVHKSKNLLDNFILLNKYQIKNYSLLELFTILFLIMRGKHKVLPVFYSAREIMEFESYQMVSAYDIFKLNKKPEELKKFIDVLSGEYAAFDEIDITEAESGIIQAIDIYCEFAAKFRKDQKLFSFYLNSTLHKKMKLYKNVFASKLRKIFGVDLKRGQVNSYESISKTGYEVHEDWLAMEQIIKKHNIIEQAPKKENIVVG